MNKDAALKILQALYEVMGCKVPDDLEEWNLQVCYHLLEAINAIESNGGEKTN